MGTPIASMKNFGKATAELMAEIGITEFEQVQALGILEVYKRMKAAYPKWTSLNLLWGLEGAVTDTNWRDITPERKAELKKMLEDSM